MEGGGEKGEGEWGGGGLKSGDPGPYSRPGQYGEVMGFDRTTGCHTVRYLDHCGGEGGGGSGGCGVSTVCELRRADFRAMATTNARLAAEDAAAESGVAVPFRLETSDSMDASSATAATTTAAATAATTDSCSSSSDSDTEEEEEEGEEEGRGRPLRRTNRRRSWRRWTIC